MITDVAIKLERGTIYSIALRSGDHTDLVKRMRPHESISAIARATHGFLTHQHEFLSRPKARKHALAIGQVKETLHSRELHYEDLMR